ncbi:CapA family protein [Mesorhizobium sp. LNHC229A00]|uniref:CapA family protein n=1 Tax=Mesorhizobium sp. LNHC229A00 TaxID=1287240 RepID=UPI0003CF5824|nr:CapA family protein [Mesorhizobium sp. LNHC229A00]ESY90365.1 hypothetical protein X741_26825 [Mesorhizobium sp. LNHC229A00]
MNPDQNADREEQKPELNSYDLAGSVETNIADGFTIVAVGDLIVSRRLTNSCHPAFAQVVEILQSADITFGNLETNIFDIRSFEGSPQAEYGGAYHLSLTETGPDLRSVGFNLVSYANNHAFDWGVEGMRLTCRALEDNGIVYAGVGENLSQAGAARFVETPKGRVGLVSSASTFTPMSRACDAAGEAPGRPGINTLRLERSIVVEPKMLDSLRIVRDSLPNFGRSQRQSDKVRVANVTFRAGERPGYSYEPNPNDVANILRNIRRGKQFSDFCIFTNHGHEPGNWSEEPPDYETEFAHQTIDAGADAYIVHGPHRLRGIEIYKGRPIFYSLGNFMMDDLRTPVGADMYEVYGKDLVDTTDADVTVSEMASGYETSPGFSDPVFYESVITVSRFEENRLAELRLYPVELGHSKRFANRGIPSLASAGKAEIILDRLQKLSEPFGTRIAFENGVGIINLNRSTE